jgi:hypothetical protein
MEDNEETWFSCDIGVCVPMFLAVCWGTGVATVIVGTLTGFLTEMSKERFAQRSVNVCCCWLNGRDVEVGMQCLAHWDASKKAGYRCTRFSLTWNSWLPRDSPRKGTQPLVHFILFQLISIFLLYQPLLNLKSNCRFTLSHSFWHNLVLDLIANSVLILSSKISSGTTK